MPLTPLSHRNGPGPTLLKIEPVSIVSGQGSFLPHSETIEGDIFGFPETGRSFRMVRREEVLQGRMGSARRDHKTGMPDIIFGD